MAIFPQTFRLQPITDERCFWIPAGTGKLDKFGVYVPVRNVRESLSQISSIFTKERERVEWCERHIEICHYRPAGHSVVSREMNVRLGVCLAVCEELQEHYTSEVSRTFWNIVLLLSEAQQRHVISRDLLLLIIILGS